MKHFDLEWLLAPLSVDDFWTTKWDKEILYLGREFPDYYGSVLVLDDIHKAFSNGQVSGRHVRLVKDGQDVAPETYHDCNGFLDARLVWSCVENGWTLVLSEVETLFSGVAKLHHSLSLTFSESFLSKIYITPPNAQGLPIHCDLHSVFVLQLSGEKNWTVLANEHLSPCPSLYRRAILPQGAFDRHSINTRQGDLLFIPRGIGHCAQTDNHLSVHLTIGIRVQCWFDLLIAAVKAVAKEMPSFRQALPTNREPAESNKAKFDAIVKQFGLLADYDNAVAERHLHNTLTGWTLTSEVYKQPLSLLNIADSSVLRSVEVFGFAIQMADNCLYVLKGNERWTFAKKWFSSLSTINNGDIFSPKNLESDATSEDRLAFCARLIEYGLVEHSANPCSSRIRQM